jgi:hypothetical protein
MRRLTCTDSLGNVIVLGNPATGKIKYGITSLTGFDSAPINRFTQKSPYQDGDTHIDSLMDERIITVEGALYTPKNLTTIMADRRTLSQKLNPKLGTYTLLYEYDGGSKTCYATLSQSPIFANKEATEPFQKFQVTFVANDPWLYGAPTTVSVSGMSNTWIQRTMHNNYNYSSIAYGAGVFVAIEGGLFANYSLDGITWDICTMPSSSNWTSVTYGAGLFVAVADGPSDIAASSIDGINWTARTLSASAAWNSVTYGSGLFVAIAAGPSNVAASSMDGINWTARTLSASANWRAVTYGNGLFVAVAYNSTVASSSTDGATWTARTLSASSTWCSIAYGSGMFVALADGITASSSTDGAVWTSRTLPSNSSWRAITYGAGLFVAIAGGPSTIAASSPDGITWTARTLPSSTNWISAVYGGGIFVAVSLGTVAATFLSAYPITVSGDYSTPPMITINGPVVNPIITSGAYRISFIFTLVAGESLIIDCSPSHPSIYYKTVTGALINALKYLDLTSTLFQLERGLNTLTFLTDTASLVYSEKYVGV